MGDAGDVVVMACDQLTGVAEPVPASGYRLRTYEPGDEAAWVRIHRAADVYDSFTLERFDAEFGEGRFELAERQFYAIDADGEPVGTATAWMPEAGVDPAYGRLHWVAVLPDDQRRGLGAALTAAALRRLERLGYRRAYLKTSEERRAALRLYERFGFREVRGAAFFAPRRTRPTNRGALWQ